jgi:hypothetical protein
MAVNCPKCQSPLGESAEFCSNCGAPTYASAPGKLPAAVENQQREHQHTPEYWLNVKCDNCNHADPISIPLGIPANGYKCPNCHCVGFLHKVEDARS